MKLPRNRLTQLNGLHFFECTPSEKLSMYPSVYYTDMHVYKIYTKIEILKGEIKICIPMSSTFFKLEIGNH